MFLGALLHVVIQGPRLVSSHGSAVPQSLGDLWIREEGEREVSHPLLDCLGPEVTRIASPHTLLANASRVASHK